MDSFKKILKPLASLKITVALFAISTFLVFAGTLAQKEQGIWTVIDSYFRCWFANIDLYIFFMWSIENRPEISFPFPGGKLIGLLLTINLLAAHIIRFKVAATGKRLLTGCIVLVAGSILTYMILAGFFTQQVAATEDAAFWRVLFRLGKGGIVAVVLYIGCVLVFKKRGGIVLIHAGILLLLVSEAITAYFAEENNMTIAEGETVNYIDNSLEMELSFTDHSNPDFDEVISLPSSLLKEGAKISHPDLPVDVEVIRYYKNSTIFDDHNEETKITNLANKGLGLKYYINELAEGDGVSNSARDTPSAYIKFTDKKTGEDIGTYLFSLWFYPNHVRRQVDLPQQLTVGNTDYTLYLRNKREYLYTEGSKEPFSIKLIDFNHDKYLGTNIPKDFSSHIILKDPDANVDREIRIWMNNPLRYAGLTFYQSSFLADDKGTVLQVVRNFGWMIPYVCCMIVGMGLLGHFGIILINFLSKNYPIDKKININPELSETEKHKAPTALKVILTLFVLMMGGYMYSKIKAPKDKPDTFNIHQFSQLPVVYQGRTKPLDTLARNALFLINKDYNYIDGSGIAQPRFERMFGISFRSEDDKVEYGKKQPAIKWLLNVISGAKERLEDKVFRITNAELLSLLELKPRKGLRYSLNEFHPKMPQLFDEARRINEIDKDYRSAYDGQVMELYNAVNIFFDLTESHSAHEITDRDTLMEVFNLVRNLDTKTSIPRVIPTTSDDEKWFSLTQAIFKYQAAAFMPNVSIDQDPFTDIFYKMLYAYQDGDVKSFNESLNKYETELKKHKHLEALFPALERELKYNFSNPFVNCIVIYMIAFFLILIGAIIKLKSEHSSQAIMKASFYLLVIALIFHTWAIYSRYYIFNYPPVTNLYESAIFISWGCVILCLIIELRFPFGISALVATITGYLSLMIANGLSGDGDTMRMMQAVLDTRFWLATHVVTISFGYVATYVAGFFAMVYLIINLFSQVFKITIKNSFSKIISKIIYGIICFALLLSFVGTVLGGLWADDSWGRFWGWDPKENGALIIVIWNALILHARWGGLIKTRGLVILALFGNVVTSWSWFGVNQLGVGLHSYGFMNKAILWLIIFIGFNLFLMALGVFIKEKLERVKT